MTNDQWLFGISFKEMIAPSLHRSIAPLLLCVFLLIPFAVSAQTPCTTDIEKSGEPDICLSVPFGGTTVVHAIGDYIVQFYKFFVGIVVTFAIFMIVVNGFKWLFSRGNSGIVDSARKGIGSAIGAVALVFVSVAMLRIINPDLLILDLPNLALVKRNMFFGEQRCFELPPGTKVVFEGSEIEIDGNPDFKYRPFECGQRYSIVDSKSQCMGTGCENAQGEIGLCVPPGNCLYGSYIVGSIQWEKNFYPDEIQLFAVCPDNSIEKMTSFYKDIPERDTYYSLPVEKAELSKRGGILIGNYCDKGPNVGIDPKGYLLGVSMNDATWPFAPTIDDDLLLDRSCGKFVRKANTAELMDWSGGTVSPDTLLITIEDLQAPFECNISLTPIQQGVYTGVPASTTKGMTFAKNTIQEQLDRGHATSELTNFLNDLSSRVAITVTSISDSNIIHGVCYPWYNGPPNVYYNMPERTGSCQHSLHSAHYGGTTLRPSIPLGPPFGPTDQQFALSWQKFSCAVDIVPGPGATKEQLFALLISMKANQASTPGFQLNYYNDESSHIHVSVKGCGVDGE